MMHSITNLGNGQADTSFINRMKKNRMKKNRMKKIQHGRHQIVYKKMNNYWNP